MGARELAGDWLVEPPGLEPVEVCPAMVRRQNDLHACKHDAVDRFESSREIWMARRAMHLLLETETRWSRSKALRRIS